MHSSSPPKALVHPSLPPEWVEKLRSRGIEATHWSQIGHEAALDVQILDWCVENGHVLLAGRLEFGPILSHPERKHPGVVRLRVESIAPAELAVRAARVLRRMADQLRQGALVTVEPSGNRVSGRRARRPSGGAAAEPAASTAIGWGQPRYDPLNGFLCGLAILLLWALDPFLWALARGFDFEWIAPSRQFSGAGAPLPLRIAGAVLEGSAELAREFASGVGFTFVLIFLFVVGATMQIVLDKPERRIDSLDRNMLFALVTLANLAALFLWGVNVSLGINTGWFSLDGIGGKLRRLLEAVGSPGSDVFFGRIVLPLLNLYCAWRLVRALSRGEIGAHSVTGGRPAKSALFAAAAVLAAIYGVLRFVLGWGGRGVSCRRRAAARAVVARFRRSLAGAAYRAIRCRIRAAKHSAARIAS